MYMTGKDLKTDAVLAIEGGVINYLAVATRQSSSVIKVSGWIHSDEFNWSNSFSFTVTI